MKRKVYLIGLDSVPVWLMKEMARNDKLDAIRWFVEKSDLQDLESLILPVTASAWLAIYTGMSEGQLGLYDFMKLNNNYEVELADYNIDQSKMIWQNSKRALIITPPMMMKPSDDPKIDMLTGFPARYKPSSQLLARISEKIGLLEEPDVERRIDNASITPMQAAKILAAEVRKKTELTKQMLRHADYDFVFLCITETDRIQHFTLSRADWREIQTPIFEAINEVFAFIRELAEKQNGEIIVVSDHGGIATYKKFLINRWLIDHGYAVLKNEQHKKPLISSSITNNDLARNIYSKMPSAIKKMIQKSGIADNYNTFKLNDLDMKNTIAFSATSTNKTIPIWFNDERFKEGRKIDKSLKLKLVKELKELDFVIKITDGHKYYGKTDKFVVPDLLVEVKDGYTIKPNEIDGEIVKPVNLNRGGEHIRSALIGTYPRILKKAKKYNVKDVKEVIEKIL